MVGVALRKAAGRYCRSSDANPTAAKRVIPMPKDKPHNDATIQDDFEVLEVIRRQQDQFTPTQKVLAEYILHNPQSLLFMSIHELAKQAKVSQATIVRFCNLLGYTGYSQLNKEAQQIVQSRMKAVGRFQYRRKKPQTKSTAAEARPGNSAFVRMVRHEQKNLNRLIKSIKVEHFEAALDLMSQARHMVVVGCMASASLAGHFGQMLCKVFPRVDVVTEEGLLQAAAALRADSRSVVILIAFPRYPAATLRLARLAAASGAAIITITDSHVSPISSLGDVTFHIPIGIPSYVDAYAAPLTFVNALCTALAERLPQRATAALDRFDRVAEETHLFIKQIRRGRPPKNGPA